MFSLTLLVLSKTRSKILDSSIQTFNNGASCAHLSLGGACSRAWTLFLYTHWLTQTMDTISIYSVIRISFDSEYLEAINISIACVLCQFFPFLPLDSILIHSASQWFILPLTIFVYMQKVNCLKFFGIFFFNLKI